MRGMITRVTRQHFRRYRYPHAGSSQMLANNFQFLPNELNWSNTLVQEVSFHAQEEALTTKFTRCRYSTIPQDEIEVIKNEIKKVGEALMNWDNKSWFELPDNAAFSYLKNVPSDKRFDTLNKRLELLREEKNLLLKNSPQILPRELITKQITDFTLETSPKSFLNQEKEPTPFVYQGRWLESATAAIISNMPQSDITGRSRVPPMVLSRCSRGGKTRGLHEIAVRLRELDPDSITLVISFNGNITDVKEDEQLDPLLALTRRIAFAASNVEKTPLEFNKFRDYAVTPQSIQDWLGVKKAVLMIDELNILRSVRQQRRTDSHSNVNNKIEEFAEFVKSTFLDREGRYFVFSTHELSIVSNLSAYLDSKSDRAIKHVGLPLIPSLQSAAIAFQMPDLSPKEALFYGRVPGLILMAKDNAFPTNKRDHAIQALREKELNDDVVVDILSSMVDGGRRDTLKPIEELMDVTDEAKLKWIPEHMVPLLNVLSSDTRVSKVMRTHLTTICKLFDNFKISKNKSGDGWEALFALTLHIRIITRKSCDLIDLASVFSPHDNFSVGFNFPFESGSASFGSITSTSTFMGCIPGKYGNLSHVAVYFPSHAQFENFDLIVVMWKSGVRVRTIGYQLKEGREYPKNSVNTFDENFVIQGDAPQTPNDDLRGWKRASNCQIDEFFGISGEFWTPENWKQLEGNNDNGVNI